MSAIIQTYPHSDISAATFQKRLDYDENRNYRALAYDYSLFIRDKEKWGLQFDNQRKNWNKNNGRHFYHFVISPDPKEHTTLEQLQELVWLWIEDNFSSTYWVATYHNDTGILHAHIVINALLVNGTKIRIDAKTWHNLVVSVRKHATTVGFLLPPIKSSYDKYLEQKQLEDDGVSK